MLSFHLRFENVDLNLWNEIKSWKYKVVLASAFNKLATHLEENVLPPDIKFGPNTSAYLCVRVRISRAKDCFKLQEVLNTKAQDLIDYFLMCL